MIFHWPQITFIVFGAIGLGIHIAKHGEPKNEHYHGGAQLILIVFELWLLYEGGFFGAQ
jgi:hypothetical protein